MAYPPQPGGRKRLAGQANKQTLVIILAVVAVALAVASAVKFLRGPQMTVVGTIDLGSKQEGMAAQQGPADTTSAEQMRGGEGAGPGAGREGEAGLGGGGKPR